MSHYCVAVIHNENQNIHDLLAPYNEAIEVDPYIDMTRQQAIDYVRKHHRDSNELTDEECWKRMAQGRETDNDGNIYTTYNPKSKWDWYREGGSVAIPLKNGEYTYEARIGDILQELDVIEYKRACEEWDEEMNREDSGIKLWYIDRYKTRENFAQIIAAFRTYAVLTPDGEWHAPGDVWWFGMSTDSEDEYNEWARGYVDRFVKNMDPDLIMTIVDCHI